MIYIDKRQRERAIDEGHQHTERAKEDFKKAVENLMLQIRADIVHCINQAWIRVPEYQASTCWPNFQNPALADPSFIETYSRYPSEPVEKQVPFDSPRVLSETLKKAKKDVEFGGLIEKYNAMSEVSKEIEKKEYGQAVALMQDKRGLFVSDVTLSNVLRQAWLEVKEALSQLKSQLLGSRAAPLSAKKMNVNGIGLFAVNRYAATHRALVAADKAAVSCAA